MHKTKESRPRFLSEALAEKPCPFDQTTLRNIEAVEKMSRHPLSHEQLTEQIARNHRPAMMMDCEGEGRKS